MYFLRIYTFYYIGKNRFGTPPSTVLAIRRTGGVRPPSKGKSTVDSPPYSAGSKIAPVELQNRPVELQNRSVGLQNRPWTAQGPKKHPGEFVFFQPGRKKYPQKY